MKAVPSFVSAHAAALPKSINEEIGFLLRIMDVSGDVLRVRLRKKKLLKLKTSTHIGKAYGPEEKTRLVENAKKARRPT